MPGALCRQVIRSHGIDYDNFKTLSIKKKIKPFLEGGDREAQNSDFWSEHLNT